MSTQQTIRVVDQRSKSEKQILVLTESEASTRTNYSKEQLVAIKKPEETIPTVGGDLSTLIGDADGSTLTNTLSTSIQETEVDSALEVATQLNYTNGVVMDIRDVVIALCNLQLGSNLNSTNDMVNKLKAALERIDAIIVQG